MPVSGRIESSRSQTHHHPTGGPEPSATGLYDPGPSSNPAAHASPGMQHHSHYSSTHQMQSSNSLSIMQRRFYNQHATVSIPSTNYYQHQAQHFLKDPRMANEIGQSYSSIQNYQHPTNYSATSEVTISLSTESSQSVTTAISTLEKDINVQVSSYLPVSKSKIEDCSDTPSGQKLTYLMQQAMQPDSLTSISEKLQDSSVNLIGKSPTNDSRNFEKVAASCEQPSNDKIFFDSPSKHFSDELVHSNTTGTSGSQKNSPHSLRTTPGRELDSPASTEPPSLPSDRANSHSLSDSKYPESLVNVLELGELETTPVSSADNQQLTPITGTSLSVPSQSDRTENNNILKDRETLENIDDEMSISPVIKSPLDQSPASTPEHSIKEQTASMLSLDITIESVLDKIRTGRGQEVEFIPCSRQQKEHQIKQQQQLKKQLAVADASEHSVGFSSHPTSPRTPIGHSLSPINLSPVTHSSAYMHHRQRINPSHEQVSPSFYVQPGNPNTNTYPPQGYPHAHHHQRHIPGQPAQLSPSALYMSQQTHHQLPMSKPMFIQNYATPNHHVGGMLPRRQPPHQHTSMYNMHPSPYAQHMSMQQQQYPLPQSNMHMTNYPMGQHQPNYMHQLQHRPSLQISSGNMPRQPYYSPTSVSGMSTGASPSCMHRTPQTPISMPPPSLVATSQPQMSYSSQEQNNQGCGNVGYYGCDLNLPYHCSDGSSQSMTNNAIVSSTSSMQFKQTPHCSQMVYPNSHRPSMGSPVTGSYTCPTVQPLQQSCFQRHSPSSPVLSSVYSSNPLMQPANQMMMMMPPPSAANPHFPVNAIPSRKRSIGSGLKPNCGPGSKRKRSDMLLHSVEMLSNNSKEELMERLHLHNYCSILQDPMVTPSLSVFPPKGGISLGKIISGKEPEKESKDIIEKPKKYSLAPYQPKHIKPSGISIKDSEADCFLIENMPKSDVPVVHNGPYLDFTQCYLRDTDTPDNPVPCTPPISVSDTNESSIPSTSLLAVFNQPSSSPCLLNRSRVCTPPIQFVYPLIVQTSFPHELLISNTTTTSIEHSSNSNTSNTQIDETPSSTQQNSFSTSIIDSETGEIVDRSEQNITSEPENISTIDSTPGINEGEKLHLTFTLNAAMAGNVPKVVRGFTDMLGIDFRAVDYEVTRASNANLAKQTADHFSRNQSEHPLPVLHLNQTPINPKIMLNETQNEVGICINTEKYNESIITVSSLIASKKQVYCKQCEMLVVDWQGIRRKTISSASDASNSSEPNDVIFCSLTCLSLYNNKLEELENEVASFKEEKTTVEYSQQLYTGEKTSPVPVLLKGPIPKHTKSGLKRRFSQDHQFLQPQDLPSVAAKQGVKRWKEVLWRRYDSVSMTPIRFYQDLTQAEVHELLSRHSLSMRPNDCEDTRCCRLCKGIGDASEEGAGRLLNLDADEWLHLNCALWCYNVYETVSGALVDIDLTSYPRAEKTLCVSCQRYGAGLPCYRSRCHAIYHLPCAVAAGCMFFTDRGMYCPLHKLKDHPLYLPTLTAKRRIYIERDETIQLTNASAADDRPQTIVFRIGSLIVHRIGQLIPDLIASDHFHTSTCIYPVGYTATRIHWSISESNRRSQYHCSIDQRNGHPVFVITYLKEDKTLERLEGNTCDAVWKPLLDKIAKSRATADLIHLYPQHIQGVDLFGLTEPHVIRAIEALPHADSLSNYVFRYGCLYNVKNTDMPVIVNLSGCARSESKKQHQFNHRTTRRTHLRYASPAINYTVQTNTASRSHVHSSYNFYATFEHTPQFKHGLHNKIHQFRRLSDQGEWRLNVQLSRSNIRGLGLFAKRELEKHCMVIECKGELVRNEVANLRQNRYKKENRQDMYLFRIDKEHVLDSTLFGSSARYIRHSCEANCTAEVMTMDRKSHIIIVANKRIETGHEITLNYKLDSHYSVLKSHKGPSPGKVSCLYGATTCKKCIS